MCLGTHKQQAIHRSEEGCLCMCAVYVHVHTGASPRIFEWGGGGTNRRHCSHLPSKYSKNRKNTGFGPLHSRIWWVRRPDFKSGGCEYPPSPRWRRPRIHSYMHACMHITYISIFSRERMNRLCKDYLCYLEPTSIHKSGFNKLFTNKDSSAW